MDSNDKSSNQFDPSPSNADNWKQRIIVPTLLAGVTGGGFGLFSKHGKVHGLSQMAATYAANFAIVTGCYCGAREFVRASRNGKPDDFLNSVIGGFGSGAILGRLQGGPAGAIRYSLIFAGAGMVGDYAILKLKPEISKWSENKDSWFKVPEWSPIQVLDEEALAAKRAKEEQIFKRVHSLNKEES